MGNGKKRFEFSDKEDLRLKSEGSEVDALHRVLASLGYLRGTFTPGTFCSCTERAVRRYQRFYGLKPDGCVGAKTKAHLTQPGCGVPDIPSNLSGSSPSAPFVLRGCKYNKNRLTYAFLNGTADLPGGREREIVREAFQAWANVANLTFEEVQPDESPDFRIAWRFGSHGDGEGFDGPSGTLAHAFFPPPCGGPNAGDLHFDVAEQWIDDPSASGILLRQVAIHEIGHLLGLRHSQDEGAVMFRFYSPDRINLTDDDIAGIRELYGAPAQSEQLLLTATASDNLARTADEAKYEIEVPGTLSVSIDGPADADFDLYVRKNEPPTVDDWDFRAFTVSSDEKITFPAEAGAKYFLMVRSFEGSGDFELKVEPNAAS